MARLCAREIHFQGGTGVRCVAEAVDGSAYCAAHRNEAADCRDSDRELAPDLDADVLPWSRRDQTTFQKAAEREAERAAARRRALGEQRRAKW